MLSKCTDDDMIRADLIADLIRDCSPRTDLSEGKAKEFIPSKDVLLLTDSSGRDAAHRACHRRCKTSARLFLDKIIKHASENVPAQEVLRENDFNEKTGDGDGADHICKLL